jgi:hypothetical protein
MGNREKSSDWMGESTPRGTDGALSFWKGIWHSRREKNATRFGFLGCGDRNSAHRNFISPIPTKNLVRIETTAVSGSGW